MSDTTAAPAATDTITPAVAPVATPAPAPSAPVDQEPAWLAGRLQRERDATAKQILAELGVADAKDAKAALKAYRDSESAKKTEDQKLRERLAALEPLETRVTALTETLTAVAQAELAKLTEVQRASVTRVAGADPQRQLDVITALRDSWTVAAPAAPPAPQNTAPAAPAPAPAAPGVTNHIATWEALKRANPVEAARYLVANRVAIAEARKVSAPNT